MASSNVRLNTDTRACPLIGRYANMWALQHSSEGELCFEEVMGM
jgi:hypothetical protein